MHPGYRGTRISQHLFPEYSSVHTRQVHLQDHIGETIRMQHLAM
jgi:hypothetical protein